jgi:VWFA-related protein
MPSWKSDAPVVFLLAVVVFGGLAFAQEAPRFSEAIDVSLVNVEVIVTGKDGERVRGLKASDFTILEEGKRQEIVNFAEYAGERGNIEVGVETAAATRADQTNVPRQPRTIIVFVDELALVASPTDIRPAIAETLRAALEPGDIGAVLSWTRFLKMRQGFTDDVDALTQAIEALPSRGPLFGNAQARQEMRESDAFWRAAMNDPRNAGIGRIGPPSGGFADSFATISMMEIKAKTLAINAAMTAMAGAEGRKVMLLVTHRLSRHPGREYALGTRVSAEEARKSDPRFDSLRTIESIAETANATGFTIYGLYPEGLSATFDSAENGELLTAGSGVIGVRDHIILMNETESLELVSKRTGGAYAIGADTLELLPRVHEDLNDYYSLAYRTPARGTDNRRRITVRVKGDYDVRTRAEYVERSDDTRMKERVISSVFGNIDPGVIPVEAKVGAISPKKTVPLTIRIPISALTMLQQNGKHAGAFTVFVSWSSSGLSGDVTKNTQPFTIAAADLERARGSHFTYNYEVKFDRGAPVLGVGVMDETSKEFGVTTVRVQ